jgi:hypothetical protein
LKKNYPILFLFLFLSTVGNSQWIPVGNNPLSPTNVLDCKMMMGKNNTPFVAYIGCQGVEVKKYTNNNWSTVGNVIYGFSCSAGTISMALDTSDNPYLLGSAYDEYARVVKYDGVQWNVIDSGANGFSPYMFNGGGVAIGDDNVPYIGYLHTPFLNDSNRVEVVRYNGSTWDTVGNVNFALGGEMYMSMALDTNDSPYVAYDDNNSIGGGFGATVKRFNGSDWDTVGSPHFSDGGNAEGISLAIDKNNIPYVVYSTWGGNFGYQGHAVVKKYNGANWENVGSGSASSGMSRMPSIAISPDGIPYVAFTDIDNGSKVTVVRYSNAHWEVVGTVGFSLGRGWHVSLTMDDNGVPYVVYWDDTLGDKAVVMKYITPSDVQNISYEIHFSLFPNPATDQINVSTDEFLPGSTITVTDLTGRKVSEVQLETLSSEVDTRNLPTGIYFLKLASPGRKAISKLIVQH